MIAAALLVQPAPISSQAIVEPNDHWSDRFGHAGFNGTRDIAVAPDNRLAFGNNEGLEIWNGSGWTRLPSLSGEVRALAYADDGCLYAGGTFDIAGLGHQYIARWDGSAWSAMDSGLEQEYLFTESLEVDPSGNLWVGGLFFSAGGKSSYRVAQWLVNTISLSLAEETIPETTASVVFNAVLAQPADDTVTVDYWIYPHTAATPDDFTASHGTLIFDPGEVSQPITIPIIDDSEYEDPESFFVRLENPQNTALASPHTLKVTIISEDLAPTTTALQANPSPSVVGQQVMFTAQVGPSLASPPTGTVFFIIDNGVPMVVPLDTAGTAVYSIESLAIGGQTICAEYSGDSLYTGSSDEITHQVVYLYFYLPAVIWYP